MSIPLALTFMVSLPVWGQIRVWLYQAATIVVAMAAHHQRGVASRARPATSSPSHPQPAQRDEPARHVKQRWRPGTEEGWRASASGCSAAFGDARTGRGGVVIIEGEAGIGKSRLLTEVVGKASRSGFRVLLGRCHESEQILPFGPWVEALRSG